MNDSCRELADAYVLALQRYFSEPEEPALTRAHELGRNAMAGGLGVLDMATVHSRALAAVLSGSHAHEDRERFLDASEAFFVEALSPFEMAHRGFWEASLALHRLNDVLEGQAKRIASALHDEAGQVLAAVHLSLAALAARLGSDDAAEIRAVRDLLDEIEQRLRELAHELRPPMLTDRGLIPALEFLTACMSRRWGLAISVHASVDQHLPSAVETTLYRITQEALTNVVRHAKATRASVTVRQAAHTIACSIHDDGIGFDAVAVAGEQGLRGLGLMEIEERVTALGGVVRLGANRPCGTALVVEIPLER